MVSGWVWAAEVLRFHLVAYKGDLKYLQQSLNLVRHAAKEEVGKGRNLA